MKTVTFCGHGTLSSDETLRLKEILPPIIENLISDSADTFLFGGYGDFDSLCATTVRTFKKKYSHITSVLVIPYIDKDYNPALYDCSEYPPIENVPRPFAILKRNEYMIDCCDVVISYVNRSYGGA